MTTERWPATFGCHLTRLFRLLQTESMLLVGPGFSRLASQKLSMIGAGEQRICAIAGELWKAVVRFTRTDLQFVSQLA